MDSYNATPTLSKPSTKKLSRELVKKIEKQQQEGHSLDYSTQNAVNYEKLMKELYDRKS